MVKQSSFNDDIAAGLCDIASKLHTNEFLAQSWPEVKAWVIKRMQDLGVIQWRCSVLDVIIEHYEIMFRADFADQLTGYQASTALLKQLSTLGLYAINSGNGVRVVTKEQFEQYYSHNRIEKILGNQYKCDQPFDRDEPRVQVNIHQDKRPFK